MTNDETAGTRRSGLKPAVRKTIFQMLVGGVAGAAAMLALLSLAEQGEHSFGEPDHVLALGTGAVYLIMGFFVGLGAMLPAIGARLLNVEDQAELRHDRRTFLVGAASTILIGVALIVLALTSTDGGPEVIGADLAAMLCGGAILLVVFLSIAFRPRQDELTRLLVTESAALAGYLVVALFGGWAILAHLGLVEAFTPLAFVAGSLALFLLSIFAAVGRRGMLTPPA